jgi:hypothetical protein
MTLKRDKKREFWTTVRITLLGAVLGGTFGVIGSDLSAFALGLATADAMIGAFIGLVEIAPTLVTGRRSQNASGMMMGIFTDYPQLVVFRSKRKPRHQDERVDLSPFEALALFDARLHYLFPTR